ncbi:MAG: AzlC family ABC transporter permease [Streptobacillus sp.]
MMDLVEKFNYSEFITGIKESKGIAIAYLPFGFTLGLIANSYDVNGLIAGSMSFLIYSGASQTLLMQIFKNPNFDIISAIFAAAMLNFRYVLINIPMYKSLKKYDNLTNCIIGLMYTDELIAYLAVKKNKSFSYAFGANLLGFLAFGISTVLGVIVGSFVPAIIINSMKFVLYGTFLSLLISSLMSEFKHIRIVGITLILKLMFMYVPPFNIVDKSLQIVLILLLTSSIYSICSIYFENRKLGEDK